MEGRVLIFDTTLRDGEQSPGCSMNREEKLRLARQLEKLRVDVIEAGFPIASPGDFEGVREIAGIVEGSHGRSAGACGEGGHRSGLGGDSGCGTTQNSHVHRHLGHSHDPQASQESRAGRPGCGGSRSLRPLTVRRCGILL